MQCEMDEPSIDSLLIQGKKTEWERKVQALAGQESQYRKMIDQAYQSFIKTLIQDQEEEAVSEVL